MKNALIAGAVSAALILVTLPLSVFAAPSFRERADARAQAQSVMPAGQGVVELDLSSIERTMSIAGLAGSVNIQVGGVTRVVSASDLLTPAEFLAASQMISSGTQTLVLGSEGQATRGRFSIGAGLMESISNLVIPDGVKLFQNFGQSSILALSGNLVNEGKLVAFSTNPRVNTATISAANIFNGVSGLISSVVPVDLGSVVGNPNLNLMLIATGDIVNAGTISSSANLGLSAAGSITNVGMPSAQVPLMQASGNVNLYSGQGQITNAGLISALSGNINVASALNKDLLVNNLGGVFQATDGSINMRDSAFMNKADLALYGGDYLSSQLNLFSGRGIVNANIGNASGTINVTSHETHLTTESELLSLGQVSVTGDPTFFNTSGGINITGNITVGEAIAIIARNDITFTGNSTIRATDGGANGANITLVAGANITSATGSDSGSIPPGSPATGNVTISSLNPVGGNITFTGSPGVTLNASGASGNGNGGNITLVAFASDGGVGGTINLPNNSLLDASGAGSGINGNIKIIAGATSGTAITLGIVQANSSSGGGGVINITTAQPVFTVGTNLTFGSNGSISSGNDFAADLTLENSGITLNNNLRPGSVATLLAGGNIAVNHSINVNSANGVNAGSIVMNAGGSLTATDQIDARPGNNANGGSVSLTSGLNMTINGTIFTRGGAATGNSGSLTLISGGSITTQALNASSQGHTGNGGNVFVQATQAIQIGGAITSSGSSTTGNSGNVEITSTNSTVSTAAITARAAQSGSGVGSGGSVLVSADLAVDIGGNIQTFGGGSSGNSGSVQISSADSTIATNQINTTAGSSGMGGNIELLADLNITISGNMTTTGGSNSGNSGTISLTSTAGNVSTQAITTTTGAVGNGGSISISTPQGNISTNSIQSAGGATSGNGGFVALIAGNLVGNTLTTNSIVTVAGQNGNGGDIYLFAKTSVQTGNINASSGTSSGSPGSITINNPLAAGSIQLGNVTATGTLAPNSFGGFQALSASTIETNRVIVSGVVNLEAFQSITVNGIQTSSTFQGGGNVYLQSDLGGAINITGNGIVTTGVGAGNASGNIVLSTQGAISVTGAINTSSSSGASAGSVTFIGSSFSALNQANITTSNLGTSGSAGTVNIAATGNISARNITANGGTTSGSGGNIFLSGGTSGTGTVSALVISSTGNGSTGNGGNVNVTAPGQVSLGTVTATSSGAQGGNLIVMAGTTGTPSAPAQTGTLTVGAINTTGVTLGGDVIIANAGASGNISLSTLTTSATGLNGIAGSMGIVAAGTVSMGNVVANANSDGSSTSALAGDLFVSSGATAGTGITIGTINLRATTPGVNNKGGNLYCVVNTGVTVNRGTTNLTGGTAGAIFSGTPTSIQNSITATTTLSFTTGSVTGFKPGGFDSINAPAGVLTIDALGDTQLIVPVIARGGDISLAGLVGAQTSNKPTNLVLLGSGDMTFNGGITSSSASGLGGLAIIETSAGSASLMNVDVSGTTQGGFVQVIAASGITLPNGSSILANSVGNLGFGGSVVLYAPGFSIILGTPDNQTGNMINASGQTGGSIYLASGAEFGDFEVSLLAQGTTGPGGSLTIRSLAAYVEVYNEWFGSNNFNANIDVSSVSSFGGSIFMSGPQAVNILRDGSQTSGGTNTATVNANGGVAGGTIVLESPFFAISTFGAVSLNANATQVNDSLGGLISMSTAGMVDTNTLSVTGAYGGTIQILGAEYFLWDGGNLDASGSNGYGGTIRIAAPLDVQFGLPGNQTDNFVSVAGITGGGLIDVSAIGPVFVYETSFFANANTGPGGSVQLSSYNDVIELYHMHWDNGGGDAGAFSSNIDVSSTSGAGGQILLIGAMGVSSLLDSSECCGGTISASFNANGATAGGSIIINTTFVGDVTLEELTAISANASAGQGGTIFVANFGAGAISSMTTLSATGSAGGGAIAAVSGGMLDLAAVNVQATTSGIGGGIYVSSVDDLSTGALNASGIGARGGTILITTAQPDASATGTTLSSSTDPSGTITVTSFNVSGSSAGSASMFTSGGATITGGGGATTDTAKAVLPKSLSITANFAISPDMLPGGGLSTFSNTATLTLSNFGLSTLPLAVTPGTVALGTVTGAGQSFSVLAGGVISFSSVNTSNGSGSGGNVLLYTLSSATNTIRGTGDLNASGSGSGAIAGRIYLSAPFGAAATTGNILSQGNSSASNNDVSIITGAAAGTGGQYSIALGGAAAGGCADVGNGNSNCNGQLTGLGTGSLGNQSSIVGNKIVFISTGGGISAPMSSISGSVSGFANGAYSLTVASGNLIVDDIMAKEGTLYLRNEQQAGVTQFSITLNSARTLFANNGNVNLVNLDSNSGVIVLGANSRIVAFTRTKATAGNVNLAIPTIPASPTVGTAPPNTVANNVNGGQVYFNSANFVTSGPTNTINAIGANVVFNAPNAGNSITMSGGVSITADPPVNLTPASNTFNGGTTNFAGLDASPNRGITTKFKTKIPLSILKGNRIASSKGSGFRARKESNQFANGTVLVSYRSLSLAPGIATLGMDTAVVEYGDGAIVSQDEQGGISLASGDMLVTAYDRTCLEFGGCRILLEPDTIALISKENGVLKIRNLHDAGRKSLSCDVDGKCLAIAPGQELLLSHDDFGKVHDSVGRRLVQEIELDGWKARTSEVSLVSLVAQEALLGKVMQSKHDYHKIIQDKIMKTAACLTVVTSDHGPYHSAGL